MKTYKIAKGWAIFIYIGSLFLIGLFGRFLFFPFENGDFSLNWSWLAIPICLGMIIFIVIGIIDIHKSKIIIDEEKVVSISIRSKKTLITNEIKGYTIEDNEIIIFPKDKTKKGTGLAIICFYKN